MVSTPASVIGTSAKDYYSSNQLPIFVAMLHKERTFTVSRYGAMTVFNEGWKMGRNELLAVVAPLNDGRTTSGFQTIRSNLMGHLLASSIR